MDILFENQYTRTKESNKEIYLYYYFKRPKLLAIHIPIAIITILCVISLFIPSQFPFEFSTVILIIMCLSIYAITIIRYSRTAEINYKRDLETNNGEPIDIKMIVTSDGIDACRANPDSKSHVSFQSIREIMKTQNYYVLLTEARLIIAFKKDGFVYGTPDEFLEFLKSRWTKGA